MKKNILLVLLLTSLSLPYSAGATEFINIGTGGVTGTYYPVGAAMCRLNNKKQKQTGIRCSVESTGATIYNLNSIYKKGEMDFGFAQSDGVYFSYNGENVFKDKPNKKLRAVMAIYPEILTLAVTKDSGIKSYLDLKGKRINMDSPGSGSRNTAKALFKSYGMDESKEFSLAQMGGLSFSEGPTLLKDGKMDGYFFMGGHPISTFTEAANTTGIDFVPFEGEGVEKLLKKFSFYTKAIIPANLYTGIEHETPSISLKAILVTSTNVSDEKVYNLTKAILDNFDVFKSTHPSLKNITRASLLTGMVVPQHPGAIRAFKEAGILK